MRVAEVRKFCPCQNRDYRKLDETGDNLIRAAMSQLNLSARAYHRILKLARTLRKSLAILRAMRLGITMDDTKFQMAEAIPTLLKTIIPSRATTWQRFHLPMI